jgi:hypothetical protein
MRLYAAAILLLALMSQDAGAAAGRYRLALPRSAQARDQLALHVSVGVVPKGTEIDVYTASGALAGTISPFGVRGGRAAGTYTVPVPGGTRSVRLVVRRFGTPPHAPSAREVTRVRLAVIR